MAPAQQKESVFVILATGTRNVRMNVQAEPRIRVVAMVCFGHSRVIDELVTFRVQVFVLTDIVFATPGMSAWHASTLAM